MKYDIIGDIHGYADELVQLLETLEYKQEKGVYQHPDPKRQAIFVGDFIDRGPKIKETLLIVKSMVENGAAQAVLGNHEYNALCFHTLKAGSTDTWLRPRSMKNINQHIETLYQFKGKENQKEWKEYLAWFMTLPLVLEFDGIRIVHASWLPDEIEKIRRWTNGTMRLSESFLQKSALKGHDEYDAIENILKGLEAHLPDGADPFEDKDGNLRKEIRVRWWESAKGKTYEQMLFPPGSLKKGGDQPIPLADAGRIQGYKEDAPVFFGHYWIKPGKSNPPQVQTNQICCVDYSIAKKGSLVAYCWSGKEKLKDTNFELVEWMENEKT